MLTKIKFFFTFLLLLSWGQNLQAQYDQIPLTVATSNTYVRIYNEYLSANQDGYLEYTVGSVLFINMGFSKINHTIIGSEIPYYIKVYSSGTIEEYVNDAFIGAIPNVVSVGDLVWLRKEGNDMVIYVNGTEIFRRVIATNQNLYPYFLDLDGAQEDNFYFYASPHQRYSPVWIGQTSQYPISGNMLARGQDGFIEYDYTTESRVILVFYDSKTVSGSNIVTQVYYNNGSFTIWVDGFWTAVTTVTMRNPDRIRIERKGAVMIVYAGGQEIKRYYTDPNKELHPALQEFTSGMRNNVYVSFDTKGGLTDTYFENLPSYASVTPETYFPQAATETDKNWTYSKIYDGKGEGVDRVVSETRSYVDDFGRLIQSQTKDYLDGQEWATATLYDNFGREAITTLPAPTGNNNISFKNDFIKNTSNQPYSTTDFDGTALNNPVAVGEYINTLGWWYSTNNTEDPWQATTDYPYTRTEYSDLTGGVRRVAGPGDEHRMGKGHETATYTMPVGTELEVLLGTKHPICLLVGEELDTEIGNGTYLSDLCTGMSANEQQYVKTITVDADGKHSIRFTDRNGNEVAKCLTGGATLRTTQIKIPIGTYRDIHIPKNSTSVTVNGTNINYDIYNLEDDGIVGTGYTGSTTLNTGFYRFVNQGTAELTLSYQIDYDNYSLNVYDDQGQLIATVAPNDVLYNGSSHKAYSFYNYNSLGWLIWEKTPDTGEINYYHRKDGRLRFSQNAKQLVNNKFSYTKYDDLDRILEVGEASGSGFANQVDNPTYPTSGTSEEIYYTYDIAVSGSGRTQNFLKGRLSKVENDILDTWYSYDEFGRTEWIAQKLNDATSPSGGSNDLNTKYIDYQYDLLGNVVEVIYQKDHNTEEFRQVHGYDINGQLTTTSTRYDQDSDHDLDNKDYALLQAKYEYSQDGDLLKQRLGLRDDCIYLNNQTFAYTLQGQLKAINPQDMTSADPATGNQVFSMALHYFEGDYKPANSAILEVKNIFSYVNNPSYTGLISAQRWRLITNLG